MYGLYVAGAGAELQSRQLKIITNNLANVNTPGFKREIGIVQARPAEDIEEGRIPFETNTTHNVGGGVTFPHSVTDFSVGPLKNTQLDTDVALPVADTFFLIDQEGEQRLTRAGNFRINPDGTLVTQNGEPILSQDGGPIVLDTRQPFHIDNQGVIQQEGNTNALAIVSAKPGDLVRVGSNSFRSLKPPENVPAIERQVRWRFLEQSSINPTSELMEMIKTSRAFEANMRMVENHDHISSQLLRRVLAT